MRHVFAIVLTALAALLSATAFAADKGCLLRGNINEDGLVQTVDYCAVNKGMPDAQFRVYCQELHANHVQDLSPAGKRRVALKFQASCPSGHKAACDGAFGQKMTLQFMAGDTLLVDGNGSLFCQSIDGRWR